MTPPRSIVVAGESIAGITAVRELRELGHAGPITVIGAEDCGAYARPPLSKAVLNVEGSVPGGSALLTWFGENGQRTVVSYGKGIPVPKLRALAD